jgi:hypothetical protein
MIWKDRLSRLVPVAATSARAGVVAVFGVEGFWHRRELGSSTTRHDDIRGLRRWICAVPLTIPPKTGPSVPLDGS